MKMFITGATGFLGKNLIRELAPKCESIYILSRKSDYNGFSQYPNIKVVKGDITKLEMIENNEIREKVFSECDYVLHAAALYDIEASYSESFLHNVVGTQNVLRLVKKMKKLKAFYYISTIAVGSEESFLLEEDIFPSRVDFKDSYSQTKYLAEKMVREQTVDLPVRIIRPGIIIGDSVTGKMDKVDGPYYFIEAFKKYSHYLKALPVVPLSFNPRTKIPLIPVDHCARFITLLIERDQSEAKLKTYHLISNELPTVGEFLNDLNQVFGLKTRYIPVLKNLVHSSLLKFLGIPKELIPFMFSKLSYDKTRTTEELPEIQESTYSTYKSILFNRVSQ